MTSDNVKVKRAGGCPDCGSVVDHEDTYGVCSSCGWAYSLNHPEPLQRVGEAPRPAVLSQALRS